MIYLISMLGVLALLSGVVTVILLTLRGHADAIVAALAGRSIRAGAIALPPPQVRIIVKTPMCRPASFQPLRAAA